LAVHLHGLGHAHPEPEITNRFLESLEIGTDDAWILERVGIRCRRTVLPLDYIRTTRNREPWAALEAATESNATLGARAARLALQRAGVDAADVGLVIAGSSATDTSAPAEACNIAGELGIEVPAFDVSSACTSFYVQLYMMSLMDPARLPDWVLLVAPETLTTTVDYDDRASAVLWGDGAAAAVVSTRYPGRAQVLANEVASSPAGRDKVVVPRGGHFRQEGRTVQMFGIKRMVQGLTRLRDAFEQDGRNLHFVGHQANLRMLESVRNTAGIAPERHHTNVEWYGNTGAASSASVLSMNWEKWRDTDDVAVVGVGAGLTWSSYLVRFGSSDRSEENA
jgi:3-oxoacyl-[acyl-carrier-protein] synthase-3